MKLLLLIFSKINPVLNIMNVYLENNNYDQNSTSTKEKHLIILQDILYVLFLLKKKNQYAIRFIYNKNELNNKNEINIRISKNILYILISKDILYILLVKTQILTILGLIHGETCNIVPILFHYFPNLSRIRHN